MAHFVLSVTGYYLHELTGLFLVCENISIPFS